VTISIRGVLTVLLPGTGSDEHYLRRAFAAPLRDAGAVLRAVAPEPAALVDGYLRALDEAAATHGRVAVGGVSLGAAVATNWALDHPRRAVAVLAALPPWIGAPGDAPAAASAQHTAMMLRRDGLSAATAAMRSSSPAWLARELTRSWDRQWPALPDAMQEAAAYSAPTIDQLHRLDVPLGVAAAPDDPIHPSRVAVEWVSSAPRAALREVSLTAFGPRPELLGAACLRALAAID